MNENSYTLEYYASKESTELILFYVLFACTKSTKNTQAFFIKESLNKEKFKLRTAQKVRLFPRKSTSAIDKKQTVSESFNNWQFSPQLKGQL